MQDAARPSWRGLAPVLHQLEKLLVHARVRGKLGMEGASHGLALPDQDGIAAVGRQHFHIPTGGNNLRSANKDHLHGLGAERGFPLPDGTVKLPSIGVASHADIHYAEGLLGRVLYFLGQQYGSGTSSQRRLGSNKLLQLGQKAVLFEKVQKRGGLAARN